MANRDRSASPPRRRQRYENDDREPGKGREHDYRKSDRDRDRDYSSRRRQRDPDSEYGKGYTEKDRERERDRDRDRYSRRSSHRDRPSTSRRSASPRERSRSRSQSRSGSPKGKPNFAPSGLLAAATNTVKGSDGTSTVLKYNEPPEARKPLLGWRLYVFKDDDQTELLHIHRQSAYLIGRDRLVADIPIEHPSCSKQHAVIQHRQVHERDEYGTSKPIIKPYIIDLESTNGTFVNDEKIPVSKFYELQASDVIKFGLSAREYVLLHDDAS